MNYIMKSQKVVMIFLFEGQNLDVLWMWMIIGIENLLMLSSPAATYVKQLFCFKKILLDIIFS